MTTSCAGEWDGLERELSKWRRAGRQATLWWRDDDAFEPSSALDRLLRLTAARRVPLALAVIPSGAGTALARRLAGERTVSVLQHGFAHRDHAAPDQPSAELGDERPAGQVLDELREGLDRTRRLFGAAFLPVLVPPWNRICGRLVPRLAELGFRGLSTFEKRARPGTAHGLVIANCHVDPIHWRRGAAFRGETRTLAELVSHLRARRRGQADAGEPTGLLTHHLRHDCATWEFLERLADRLVTRPELRWLAPRQVFAP